MNVNSVDKCEHFFIDQPKISQIFIEYDASVNAKNKEGRTPLHFCAEYGSVVVLQKPLKYSLIGGFLLYSYQAG